MKTLKTFEHFPDNKNCPLCGKSTDKECILVSIDNTQEGNICKAAPVHVDCINSDGWSLNLSVGVLYREVVSTFEK